MAPKLAILLGLLATSAGSVLAADCPASRLHLTEPPYDNYFLSDCITSAHVIVTSPNANSNAGAKPRMIVAWPAGNSGAAAYFEPENGGTLGLHLENSTSTGQVLETVNEPAAPGAKNQNPRVGVQGLIHFDAPALLTLPILGSIRTIRDYSEGGGRLSPEVQNAVVTEKFGSDGGQFWRTWFDGVTSTWIDFKPTSGAEAVRIVTGDKWMLRFSAGTYQFRATFNYPQLDQLSPTEVLNKASQGLTKENPDQTTSLSFLSYSNKLLAGSWRFLTYFGRDSMLSALLMQSILSQGEDGAIEAVIGAVLERVNKEDGTVCHEENLGDYATYLARQQGINSNAPSCDYKMIDTDFMLPILMKNYFLDTDTGKSRAVPFLSKKATFLEENAGMAYEKLAQRTAEKIMKITAPFARDQSVSNLLRIKDGEAVGQWRDSNVGLGGGRIPYDVNTALAPAGLRAVAALSKAGFFPDHIDWADLADEYATVWEDKTLKFFEVNISRSEAQQLVEHYHSDASLAGPSNTAQITDNVRFYGLSLGGNDNKPVRVLNTDDCFRLFLLNSTNQEQLSQFLDQTADHILQQFPVGLLTDVGLLVANPAYAGDKAFADQFKNSDYHGTVVWSWQLSMMAAGLGRQLARCGSSAAPDFCSQELHNKVKKAYTTLWDTIDKNRAQLSGEVWSWKYEDNAYQPIPLSTFSTTESNIVQLWSLTFLAVHRQQVSRALTDEDSHRIAWSDEL